MLAFGAYEPDKMNYQGGTSRSVLNVVPRADGYGPWPSFSAYSAALPATCRGMFYARKTDGTVEVFGATSNKLMKLDRTTLTWIPVMKSTAVTSITNASPAVVNLTAHGLAIGDAVVFTTTGTLPTGLTAGTVYYIITAGFTANAFEVSATSGGTAINTSSAGSGTHSVTTNYTALPNTDHWQFAQFGNFVIAVQANVVPQVFDISSSTVFADLGGSPPQARYIAVVGRFVVLSGLLSTPYRIQWSGLNATTTWTSGVNSSDFQDFPDGGVVRGVAGGEYGIVFQDGVIRSMIYAVGSTYVFQFVRIAEDKGLLAPYSIVRAGPNILFLASQGFHIIVGTAAPVPIGKEKVDRTFFGDYDQAQLQLIIGASDPQQSRVYWAYKSQSGLTGLFDKMLCYDYALQQWSIIAQTGEYLSTLAAPGVTLEGLDSISSSLDALTFSLDDVALSALPKIVMADSNHKLGFFSGANLEATLDTAEQRITGARARIKGMYPVTDAPACYGAVGYRENMQSTVSYSTEQLVTSRGVCHANVSTPLARGRMRIPAGTVWTFASGFDPDLAKEGRR